MPQPERLITLLRRAGDIIQATPGRRGHVIYLSDVADVCVAGDLHGNVGNFSRLLGVADLAKNPGRHLVVQEVIHGKFRYPGNGDKSHQLVDLIAALTCQFPGRVHYLPGNHELSQWTNRLIGKGDEDLNDLFRLGVETAYKEHAGAIYDAYMRIIAVGPLVVRTPNRVYLSHSLPGIQRLESFNPAILEGDEFQNEDLALGGTVHSLVWGRTTAEEHVAAFLRKVDADWLITGHIPQEQGFAIPNSRQLILDAQGSPACYCLFPCDRPLSLADLEAMIGTIG
jgi:Calcineurin-like phosphoesterase